MPNRPDPTLAPTQEARTQAQALLAGARHAALAYLDAGSGTPGISRIALGPGPDGGPLTLISALAPHWAALQSRPEAAILVGDVGPKGDPLTHPRLMIRVMARFVDRTSAEHALCRDHYLLVQPKAKLYVDFADFAFVHLAPVSALLNGGFARAFRLTAADLTPK
jgi:heme iron utilization protein